MVVVVVVVAESSPVFPDDDRFLTVDVVLSPAFFGIISETVHSRMTRRGSIILLSYTFVLYALTGVERGGGRV